VRVFTRDWLSRRLDPLNPQERAMEGPAVYPTNAPATAPIGPNTTAPDKAPKAASPPRSWANAPTGTSVKDTSAATISLCMCVSRNCPSNRLRPNCGCSKEHLHSDEGKAGTRRNA
jgi:hypothetical protein